MSSKFRNKNLLFFCRGDQESNEFLNELNKNEPLKGQFILIDQNNPKIQLPSHIANIRQPLILVPNGAKEAIVNKEAIFWIKNNCFSDKANGLEFMDLGGNLVGGAPLEGPGAVTGTTKFSVIGTENMKIDTYMEGSGNAQGGGANSRYRKSETDMRFERYQKERNELDAKGRPQQNMIPNFGR